MSRKKQRPPKAPTTHPSALPIRDGEEITYIPGSASELKARAERDLETLKPLFRDPRFFQQVEAIRDKFNIPSDLPPFFRPVVSRVLGDFDLLPKTRPVVG